MPTILDLEPPPGCIVRFISDLHLTHKRSTAPPPAELVKQMNGINMLVLCGDTTEMRLNETLRAQSMAARDELRELCSARGIELIEIAGNHDPDEGPMLARFWGGRVLAMHGHALLKEVSPWSREYLEHKEALRPIISKYSEKESDLTESLEHARCIARELARYTDSPRPKRPRNALQELRHCFWPPERPLLIVWNWLTYAAKAERWMRRCQPNAEVLIFGHFHRAGRWKYGKRLLFNTGAWFEHASPYAVDMQDAHVLRHFPLSSL